MSCDIYVRGFVRGMLTGDTAHGHYCPPDEGLSVDQARLIAEKYLREYPEHQHKEAGLMVVVALVRAFLSATN